MLGRFFQYMILYLAMTSLPVWSVETTFDAIKIYNDSIQPLFETHCFRCHGPEKQKSELRIDVLDVDMIEGQSGGKWREIVDALNRGDMPPEDEPQPTIDERRAMIDWLDRELTRAALARRSTGGKVTLRRLTRGEYNNTMRDLLGVDLDYARELPPDTRGIDGYKNNGVYMGMSDQQIDEYYKAAKKGLATAIVEGDPIEPIQVVATNCASGVRFDKLVLAPFDEILGGTVVGFSQALDRKTKLPKGPYKENAMVLLCKDHPPAGEFRVTVKASVKPGDSKYAPPYMLVEVGHKTGVGIEPRKILGEGYVTAGPDAPQTFVFTGRLEEFPLHDQPATKKFPGLRVIITDPYALSPPQPPKVKRIKGEPPPPPPAPLPDPYPRLVIHEVSFETPVDQSWPPVTHRRILPPRADDMSEEVYISKVLRTFMVRAWRRPVTDDEVGWATRYLAALRPEMPSFEEAMRETFALVLTSPKFLYLPEFRTTNAAPLDDYELATRLSYFIWGTMPDAELSELARKGELNNDPVLKAQVERLLADERSQNFVDGFASQWLQLDNVDAVAVNPEFYPDFDNALKEDMKRESLAFFAKILAEDASCLNFISSDFVVVNDRMAKFYGLDVPEAGDFRKVSLSDDSVRGGVLTQASFLLGNSNGEQSHPIYRAKWFLDRLMGEPPGEPPADVPELDQAPAVKKKLTLKQQLEEHRNRPTCIRCHRTLDPWGIPFEGFNAIGQYMPADTALMKKRKGLAIEDQVVLPDGAEIQGSEELKRYLIDQKKDDFAEGFSRHLLTYALGRSLEWTDQPLINTLSEKFKAKGYRMQPLIIDIVLCDAFRRK